MQAHPGDSSNCIPRQLLPVWGFVISIPSPQGLSCLYETFEGKTSTVLFTDGDKDSLPDQALLRLL